MTTPSRLAIEIDEYGEFRVRFPLPTPDDAVAAYVSLAEDRDGFRIFDVGDDWVIFDSRRSALGISIAFGPDPFVEVSGPTTLEGEDALDHTRVPTELSLSDRLVVAAIARKVFAIEARS